MATAYSTVRYGSTGTDVSTLQEALNKAGYSLVVDGVFGSKTQAAVKSYQQANGLTVDGVAGSNTWSSLTSASDAADSVNAASNSNSSTLDSLIASLQANAYTPKTDAEIQSQAEGEYQSYYDQLRLAAEQQSATSDLAFEQQRDALQATYDKQREASADTYAKNYSTAGNELLSRGMQRSSYGTQTLANVNSEGAKAQQAIFDQQVAAETTIDQQRTQLASQLAAQIAQYDASQAADVLNRMRELEDQEYDRSTDQASLSTQIYQLLYQQQRDAVSDAQWMQQFEESVRQFNVSASKNSGGSSSKKATDTDTTQAANDELSWDFYMALMDSTAGSGSSGNTSKSTGSKSSNSQSSLAWMNW